MNIKIFFCILCNICAERIIISVSVRVIELKAFYDSFVKEIAFMDTFGWEWFYEGDKSFSADLEDPEQNATNLRSTYVGYALIR